jgi:hypothetical protein
MRRSHFAMLFLLVVAAQPLVAATYYVGTCEKGAYGTIQAAVNAVSMGSIIDVCPGTYPEQVIISKALTLRGIVSNNSSQVVIAMPSSGLMTTPAISFTTVAPQMLVTAGPVNITNLAVDGTAATNCPTVDFVGIYYASGSSGTVNRVESRNHDACKVLAVAILVDNGAGVSQSVTIENTYIHEPDFAGIVACSEQNPSTLTATITGNYVASGKWGIAQNCNTAGSISDNFVEGGTYGGLYGIGAVSPFGKVSANTVNNVYYAFYINAAIVVSGNTVSNSPYGLLVGTGATVTSNKIMNSSFDGISLTGNGVIVKNNAMTNTTVGIEFNCNTGTITGNTINEATTTGIDKVPAAFTGVNYFYNVAAVRTGGAC